MKPEVGNKTMQNINMFSPAAPVLKSSFSEKATKAELYMQVNLNEIYVFFLHLFFLKIVRKL